MLVFTRSKIVTNQLLTHERIPIVIEFKCCELLAFIAFRNQYVKCE